MPDPLIIFGPLSLFKLKPGTPSIQIPPGIVIMPLDQALRGMLFKAARERECSGEIIEGIRESSVVVLREVPGSGVGPEKDIMAVAMYRHVLERMMARIFEGLQLFQPLPEYYLSIPWFTVGGTLSRVDPGNIRIGIRPESIAPLDMDWHQLAEVRIEEEQPDGQVALEQLRKYWPKLGRLARLDLIEEALYGAGKLKGYLAAGNENIAQEAAKWAQERHEEGQWPPPNTPAGETPKAPKALTGKWFMDGFLRAYRREIDKLSAEQGDSPPKIRWSRGAALFRDAMKLESPYRMVTLITCLEALFSLNSSELRFQLASRIAWLLSRSDPNQRRTLFDLVGRYYDLRSKIVHGDQFDMADVLASEGQVEWLIVRRAFWAILDDDRLFNAFIDPKPNAIQGILKELMLGVFPTESEAKST